ncbi:MAG TPA: hypothetical protein VFT37_01490 [Telluria sp.]|nr:hypothetical protein [Telluria sp.]
MNRTDSDTDVPCPWDQFARVLTDLAANPSDWELRKKEALCIAALAHVAPDGTAIAPGYFEDRHGNRINALVMERALGEIATLLNERSDPELLAKQADLTAKLEDGADEQARPRWLEKLNLQLKAWMVAKATLEQINDAPTILHSTRSGDVTRDVSDWFTELAPSLKAAGFSLASPFENVANTERMGQHRGQLWVHSDPRVALIAEAVPGVRLVLVISRLSNGTILVTGNNLGGFFHTAGPVLDGFAVFPGTPVAEMVRLHSALLARRLAGLAGVSALPILNLAHLAAAENHMRTQRTAFRRRVGLTDAEVRGMPVKHHAYFAKKLKAKVARRLAAGA